MEVASALFSGSVAASLPTFSHDQIATFLEKGFWDSQFFGPAKFNMGTSGPEAKGGVLHYNTDGLTPAARALAEKALAIYETVLDINFVRTSSNSTDDRRHLLSG